MNLRTGGLAVALALVVCASTAGAQTGKPSTDPFVGTWILNRALSKYSPGPPPEKRIVTITIDGEAFKESVETTRQFRSEFVAGGGGGTETSEYTARFDGAFVPITNSGLSTVALKRVDARTIERTGKVGSEVVETSRRSVSPDRKRLTITTEGNAQGMDYSSVQVFDRAK